MILRPFHLYLAVLTAATVVAAVITLAPRLAPVRQDGLPALPQSLAIIDEVPQRARVLGYERELFGAGWQTSGSCSTRERVIATQFSAQSAEDCPIAETVAADPYTGQPVSSADVEVDHVLPLSAAWDLGAHRWDGAQREDFANDPLNLVAVGPAANRDKSDQLPSRWLPPDPAARCWYSERLAAVAAVFQLPLPADDVRVMRAQCRMVMIGSSAGA